MTMFNVGDIVRQKQSIVGRDNKVYYALIVSIQYSPCHDISLSRITAQWLNWDDKSPMTLYQTEALKWWEKVSDDV